MGYSDTLLTISKDPQFEISLNFDPDNLEYLDYYDRLPNDFIMYCRNPIAEGQQEPFFEDAVNWLNAKIKRALKARPTKARR